MARTAPSRSTCVTPTCVSFTGTVVGVRSTGAIALDRTAFYPTGGGQPHDTGTLGGCHVTEVRKDGRTRVAHR